MVVCLLSLVCFVHLDTIGWRRSYGIILVQWFPSDKGGPKFLEGLLLYYDQFSWESLTYLLFLSSLDKEILVG